MDSMRQRMSKHLFQLSKQKWYVVIHCSPVGWVGGWLGGGCVVWTKIRIGAEALELVSLGTTLGVSLGTTLGVSLGTTLGVSLGTTLGVSLGTTRTYRIRVVWIKIGFGGETPLP
jgi:hypothetical protein